MLGGNNHDEDGASDDDRMSSADFGKINI